MMATMAKKEKQSLELIKGIMFVFIVQGIFVGPWLMWCVIQGLITGKMDYHFPAGPYKTCYLKKEPVTFLLLVILWTSMAFLWGFIVINAWKK